MKNATIIEWVECRPEERMFFRVGEHLLCVVETTIDYDERKVTLTGLSAHAPPLRVTNTFDGDAVAASIYASEEEFREAQLQPGMCRHAGTQEFAGGSVVCGRCGEWLANKF
jgi:hypothetical protein